MRKLLGKACFLAVLAALFLTCTAAAADLGTGIVTGDSLRMRTAPSTDAATVVYLSKGTEVRILEKLDGWYKAAWNDNTGYLAADYVSFTPAEGPEDLTGKTGVISGNSVNFRSGPSTDADILTTLDEGAAVALLQLENGWCQAIWQEQTGYVSADYVTVDGLPLVDPKGIITGDCVNVRSAPSTDGSIVTKVYAGTVVDLISLQNDWYAISYDGLTGYISADYLKLYSPSTSSGNQAIADKAQEYLGVPYVYGGSSSKGFDCSGFTMYIFGLFGYSLPHSASSQWNSIDTSVAKDDLQPGDLVFFNDPSISGGKACSHVGIYIGDGQFVHASSGSSGRYVRISSLSESYYSKYYKGAKRVA